MFDTKAYRHACRVWALTLEISVTMAQFPSYEIACRSHQYRTLGLGYANLGALLMVSGIPYDSEESRAISGALTAILTGACYAMSAEMARDLGPFSKYPDNKSAMMCVMRNHEKAVRNCPDHDYEGLTIFPQGIKSEFCPPYLIEAARKE